MLDVFIIPVFAIIAAIGLPIICITILIAMCFRRGCPGKRDRAEWNEETCLMQQMHDDMFKMEPRIEALETILMGRFGKDNK